MYGMYVVMIVALEVCFDIGIIWVFPTNLQIGIILKKPHLERNFFEDFLVFFNVARFYKHVEMLLKPQHYNMYVVTQKLTGNGWLHPL